MTRAHKATTRPYSTSFYYLWRWRRKSTKFHSPNITSQTTLLSHLIKARALDNGICENQRLKSMHSSAQTYKPHHTTTNASTHKDASIRLHRIANDYKLTSTDNRNSVTHIIATSPLDPRILCSKHTTCGTLMLKVPLSHTPPRVTR